MPLLQNFADYILEQLRQHMEPTYITSSILQLQGLKEKSCLLYILHKIYMYLM
jgi:hypothetical protein